MKKLINVTEIVASAVRQDQAKISDNWDQIKGTLLHQGSGEQVLELAEQVRKSSLVHFYSDGAWNMHQLLLALIDITGPAKLFISSYAMSETAVRCLTALREAGQITRLSCVIDNRVETRSAGSFQLLRSICDRVVLRMTHAKVTVIEGKDVQLLVIGSANYTENKRMEVGVIVNDRTACDFHRRWINKILSEDETRIN